MSTARNKLERHILAFLRDVADPREYPGLLVALSGGSDSMALLHLVAATRQRHGRPVLAGHVNHGIRHDSGSEERRLRELCARLGIAYRSDRLQRTQEKGPGPNEETLRHARYRILRRFAREADCRCWILLGHQEEDQAETVLFNLVRGTGLTGLAGMRRRRGIFLRPLLDIPRAMLRRYLDEIEADWVDDPTNLDLRYARNRIRHQILPALERDVRPRATAAIARAARHLAKALDALDAEAEDCLSRCRLSAPPNEVRLDARRLRSYHEGLIERTLRLAVRTVRGSTSDIPASLWQGIGASCRRGGDGRFDIRPDTSVEITERTVRFSRAAGEEIEAAPMDLPRSGHVSFLPDGAVWTQQLRPPLIPSRLRIRGLSRMQVFDADAVRLPAQIRLPQEGDRLITGEAAGSHNLADLLSERGIPRSLRSRQPVIEDTEGILWVPGIRRAPRARIADGTKRIWIVRWVGGLPVDQAVMGGGTRG